MHKVIYKCVSGQEEREREKKEQRQIETSGSPESYWFLQPAGPDGAKEITRPK